MRTPRLGAHHSLITRLLVSRLRTGLGQMRRRERTGRVVVERGGSSDGTTVPFVAAEPIGPQTGTKLRLQFSADAGDGNKKPA
jgi:hypothetical protein